MEDSSKLTYSDIEEYYQTFLMKTEAIRTKNNISLQSCQLKKEHLQKYAFFHKPKQNICTFVECVTLHRKVSLVNALTMCSLTFVNVS